MPQNTFLAVHAGVSRNVSFTESVCMDAVCSSENVIEAVKVLENSELTNAGFGSSLNFDGNVECEAAYSTSQGNLFGAVGGVSSIQNPVEAAAALAKGWCQMSRRLVPPQVLVGRGAEQWAKENGIVICDPTALISQRAKKAWEQAHDVIKISKHTDVSYSSDTVGAVSFTKDGVCCAACSSGGMILKTPGRLGHTTQIGGAIWAEQRFSRSVAVTLTGCGECIARTNLAKCLAENAFQWSEESCPLMSTVVNACNKHFLSSPLLYNREHAYVGGLVLFIDGDDKYGEMIAFQNTGYFSYAFGKGTLSEKHHSCTSRLNLVSHSVSLSDYDLFD